jgi:hypothetical protein
VAGGIWQTLPARARGSPLHTRGKCVKRRARPRCTGG